MADISAIKALDGVTYSIKDSEARDHLVPASGTTGQVLTKTASGYGWADASGGGTSFTILASNWGNATTINTTTYYPYVINLTKIYDVHPVIGIGASGVLPTDAEQEAFNAWKYAVVDDVNLTLTLYAEEIPTNDFTIVTKGVA